MSDIVIPIDIFDIDSVNAAKEKLRAYYRKIDRKAKEICERLAKIGEAKATAGFSKAIYDGKNDVVVTVRQTGETQYVVEASGESVLFIEFGSGATHGYGHPDPQGYGPGTYPSDKGHWNDPNGWYYAHGKKSFGNPPAAAMYHAEQDIRDSIEKVVKEVFGSD